MRMTAIALGVLTILGGTTVVGCGGAPKPVIRHSAAAKDSLNLRVNLLATNHSKDWEVEKPRLRITQIWLDDDDVPVKSEILADQGFETQGTDRSVIVLKDFEGEADREVRLTFEVISGKNESRENISENRTITWYVPSGFVQKDLALRAALSRAGKDDYRIDVLRVTDLDTGESEQLLPNSDEH